MRQLSNALLVLLVKKWVYMVKWLNFLVTRDLLRINISNILIRYSPALPISVYRTSSYQLIPYHVTPSWPMMSLTHSQARNMLVVHGGRHLTLSHILQTMFKVGMLTIAFTHHGSVVINYGNVMHSKPQLNLQRRRNGNNRNSLRSFDRRQLCHEWNNSRLWRVT